MKPLVEAAATAYRPRDPDGTVRAHPAWYDLDAQGREEAFAAAVEARRLERALDPEGLSSSAKAVLGRLTR